MSHERWQELKMINPLAEIYLLQWPAGEWSNFDTWGKALLDYLPNIADILPEPFKQYFLADFNKKRSTAKMIGLFLGMVIAEQSLFSNCEINLIGFSLGTDVILSFLEVMQALRIVNYPINNIILLGGVACKTRFAQLNEEVLQCNIFNVYSEYDDVLPLALKNSSKRVHPCGLGPI